MHGRRCIALLFPLFGMVLLSGIAGCAGVADPASLILIELEPVPSNAPEASRDTDWHRRIVALDLDRPGDSGRWVTRGFWSASSPAISYDGRRFLFAGRRESSDALRIWEIWADGTGARPVTDARKEARHASYLPDGRIVFSGLDTKTPAEESSASRSLFVCNHDGSQVRRITYGVGDDTRSSVLDDGRILFAHQPRRQESDSAAPPAVWMTVRPDGSGVARFHGAYSTLTGAIPADWRPPAGTRVISVVRANQNPAPRALTSVVNAAKDLGTLLCLDVRTSQLPHVSSLDADSIRSVRAYAAGHRATEVLLGEAPIEPDGSFFLQVPANMPLRLTLVGDDGKTLESCDGSLWVRPNENRGCIGCHEDPDLVPENRVPLAVRASPATVEPEATPRMAARGGR